ncbi:MAG: DEAD/DEAH box helicase, partial [Phycisphaeraceae bacterium]
GLTATPFRLDGQGLGDLFGKIVVAAQAADLVEQGHLVAPRVFAPTVPDLGRVRRQAGDFNLKQAAQALEKSSLIGDVVREWHHKAPGRRTVCFALNVAHSRQIVAAFQAEGVAAEHLDGKTPKEERDAILARLASGETTLVSNCMVLTEGWDLPALECAIIARPTASLNLHLQMLGRIMRACPGKTGAIVLDHAGNHHRHGPASRRLEYSLGGRVRVAASEPLGLRQCPECFAMYPVGAVNCPECGTEPPVQTREVATGEGELAAYRDDDFAVRALFWQRTKEEQKETGRAEGWAFHRFRERFGEWPVVVEGELVDPGNATSEQKQAVYERFLGLAEERGYSAGWASHRYRETFGVWPQGFVGKAKAKRLNEKWKQMVA